VYPKIETGRQGRPARQLPLIFYLKVQWVLSISSTHIIHGFKTALAAVLAYAATIVLNLEFGHWAVITAIIVMQVYVADSVEMCLYRFSGTLIGAVLGVVVILFIPKTSFFVGLALFVIIGICAFLTRYKTRYRLAAITTTIIFMTGLHAPNIFVFGTYRVIEICIGIFCAFGVSVLIFPKRSLDVLRQQLESQALICSDKCSLLVNAFIARQKNVEETLVDDLLKDVWGNHALLEKISRHEALMYKKKFNENFLIKVTVMSRSAEHLRNMVRALNSLEEDGCEIIMSPELKKLAKESGKALVMLMKNEMSPGNEADLEAVVGTLEEKLLKVRREGLIRRFDSKRLIQVFSFYSSLLYFAEDILSGIKEV
jgi:uncharacterized membrane protein YgaE (UPF0421/DUF939 family)